MASLSLKHIYKIYQGGVRAVSDFNLDIDDKEFIVFVGPSGCGKSTTLRMVAGLEEISAGELYIDDKLVNDVEPKDRDIAMVFQNYALYPHMTVYDNMAFGLRLRKMNSQEIDSRVQEAAAILGITPLLTRKPKALSGGQRQRVALGRAIVREPKVFLLDEPLSNLDAKLRVQMRTEITKLHNKLATTFIYVTHDQTEAMTMGTRIVVMKDGIVQQVDTPQCLYDYPENIFVATFLGSPQMNLFDAVLERDGGKVFARFGENRIEVPDARARRLMDEAYFGKPIKMGVRPEDIHDEEVFIAGSPNTIIKADIDVIEKLGNETILYMKVDGKEDYTIARIDARSTVAAGESVKLALDANHIHFFDPETELTIMGVPRANRIPAKLLAEPDKLTVRFGNVKIDLPESITEKLVSFDQINSDVILEIAPDALLDKEGYDAAVFNPEAEGNASYTSGEYFEIDGAVDFVEKYPRFTAAYVAVPGKKGYIVAKLPIDTKTTGGDKIKLYCSVSSIQLRDIDTNNKLIASKKVTTNKAAATVAVKETMASIAFGKSKLAINTNETVREGGTYDVYLDKNAFSINVADVKKNPKQVIVGRIQDADVMGDKTLVYVAVDGIEEYLCAMVSDPVNLSQNDKIKLYIAADGVSAKAPEEISAIIAEKAAEAPAYVFEAPAEKPAKKEKVETEAAADAAAPAKKPAAKKPAAKKPAAKKSTAKK